MTGSAVAVQRWVTVLANLSVLLTGLNGGWVGPFLPQMAEAQGAALDRAGLLVSAKFLGFMITVVLTGAALDRWGGRVVLGLSLALMAVGQLGIATLPGLPALLASGLVLGLGFGILDVAGHVVIVQFNRERVTAALNYLNVSFAVGALVGPLIAGVALRGGVPYRAVYGAGAAVAVLFALLYVATPLRHERTVRVRGGSHPGSPARESGLLARPVIWALGGVMLLYVGAEAGLGAWLFTYLRRVGGLEEAVASWSVSLFWVGLVGGRLLGARLADRVTTGALTLAALALTSAALAGLAFGPSWLALQLPAAVLVGVGLGPIYPNVIAVGAALFPQRVSTMTSRLITFASIGGIAGPWVVGRALVLGGPRQAMAVVCAMGLGMLALFWLAERLPGEARAGEARPVAAEVGTD